MSVLWQKQTHGVQKRKEQVDRTIALFFLAIVAVVTLLGAAYLSLAAANVHLARQIWQLEETLAAGERANQALMIEVARLSSIPVLQQRSIALGYIPAENVDFLKVTEP